MWEIRGHSSTHAGGSCLSGLVRKMLSKALALRRLPSPAASRAFSTAATEGGIWTAAEAGDGQAPLLQAHDLSFYQQFDVPSLGKYHNYYPENTPSFNLMER